MITGKGPSIWDTITHNGGMKNNDTGDVACDTYHKFREDTALLQDLKVTSIILSWNYYKYALSARMKQVLVLILQYRELSCNCW